MKRVLIFVTLSICLATLVRGEGWAQDYSRLLEKYVTPQGVKYEAWHSDKGDLGTLEKTVKAIAAEKAPGDRDAKLAFYLNAYNANILEQVLSAFPVKSVRDIAPFYGVFTQKRIKVSGEQMSFNHLEKDVILGLKDPRVHFALNCASASCPPLRNEAYAADALDSQLDEQAKAFLDGNPRGVKVEDGGKAAAVSKIFDWDAGDFISAGGPVGFINKYRKPPLPAETKVTYQDYDWSLNSTR